MKKISFILPDLNNGGVQRNTINIANYLSNKYQKKILTIYNLDTNFFIYKDIELESLNKKKLIYSIFKLYFKIKSYNPDVIYSSLGYINIIILFLKIFLPSNFKYIIREANFISYNLRQYNFSFIAKICFFYLYKFADYLICSSDEMKKDLIKTLGKEFNNKITIMQNFVDVDQITNKINKKNLKKNNTNILLVTAGRLNYQKGYDILIKHFAKFKYTNKKYTYYKNF